jgi:hypothetical protein
MELELVGLVLHVQAFKFELGGNHSNDHADSKGVGSYLRIFVDVYHPNSQLTSYGIQLDGL